MASATSSPAPGSAPGTDRGEAGAPAAGLLSHEGLLSGFNSLAAWLWGSLGVLAMCFIAAISFGAEFLNSYSRDRSLHLSTVALQRSSESVGFITRDYAVWDEAHEKLNISYDADWATRWLGDWASSDMDMQMAAVIDADGRLIFMMADGVSDTTPEQDGLSAGISALAKRARSLPWNNPTSIDAFLSIEGAVILASAIAVTPETPSKADIATNRRSTLIFMRRLDQQWLAKFSNDQLLPDLQLVGTFKTGSRTALPLLDSEGALIGALQWSPDRPGTLLFARIGPWLSLLALLGAGVVTIAVRHQRLVVRHAQGLIETLQTQNDQLYANKRMLSHALQNEQKSNHLKREFMAIMSHELRTPLNAVIGFSQFMLKQALGPVGSPKYLDYARDIHGAGTHLLGMIDEILDFSHVESGRISMQLEAIELGEIAEICVRQLQPYCAAKQVEFLYDAQDRPFHVCGDEARLRQITLNLLTNAVKASPPNSRVKVSLRLYGFDVKLRVTDRGRGIDAADIQRIFEPFERAKKNGKTYGEGVGLGLAVVSKLVEAHGGSVRLWSKPNLGTVAEVRLPMLHHGQVFTSCSARAVTTAS